MKYPEFKKRVIGLMNQNRQIDCINFVREQKNISIGEARDMIRAITGN